MVNKTEEDKRAEQERENKESNRSLRITFRIFQAIFLGILALGVSSIFGDLGKAIKLPISSFSIATTIFGLIGAIATGSLANSSKDW